MATPAPARLSSLPRNTLLKNGRYRIEREVNREFRRLHVYCTHCLLAAICLVLLLPTATLSGLARVLAKYVCGTR